MSAYERVGWAVWEQFTPHGKKHLCIPIRVEPRYKYRAITGASRNGLHRQILCGGNYPPGKTRPAQTGDKCGNCLRILNNEVSAT